MPVPLYNLSPVLTLLGLGLLLALAPVAWVMLRHQQDAPHTRWRVLTLVTLFLTLDLILFGAFTRLTDSGLGCPDWPGCYGAASPVGAHAHISAAQASLPSGPVTIAKAWIEMTHRYLATGVGALITLLMVVSWIDIRKGKPQSSLLYKWLPTLTFVWVCVQGAFGALTVTMKLFPAIVSLHLLGAYLLLALLTLQVLRARDPEDWLPLEPGSRVQAVSNTWIAMALFLLVLQAASGAWVSTNYAVLACTEFPKCQGQWWPAMDFERGFDIWRPLGENADGSTLSFQAMTAIHVAHRTLALLTIVALATLAWMLRKDALLSRPARWLGALVLLQFVTGLSNVVLGWPMAAAIAHTGGAAVMVALLVWMLGLKQGLRTPR